MKILSSHEQNQADPEVWVFQNGILGLLLKQCLGADLKDSDCLISTVKLLQFPPLEYC